MADEAAPATILVAPPATVTTTVKRRGWKIIALNTVSLAGTLLVLLLSYLQTLDLSAILSPRDAFIWTAAINVANIVLRQWFSPATVTEQRISQGTQ